MGRSSKIAGFLGIALLVGAAATASPAEGLGAPVAGSWMDPRTEVGRSEYRFAIRDGELQAPNRAHGLRSWVTMNGITVEPREPGGAGSDQRLVLSLVEMARGADTFVVGPGVVTHDGARAEILREGVTEWFVNDTAGLEHGLEIPFSPVEGELPLVLKFRLDGNLLGYPLGEDAVEFRTADGKPWVVYRGLVVRDALGDLVPSRMRLVTGALEIVLEDSLAVYPLSVDPLFASASWSQEGNQTSAFVGASSSTAGDVNGDGYSDILISAYGYDAGQINEGRVWVYYGSASGPKGPPAIFESNQAGAQFGFSIGAAGDINNDGYDDFLVGANLYDSIGLSNAGAVYVYHGGPAGPTLKTVRYGVQAGAQLGRSVATAGDVNNDGYADIIAGAYAYDAGQTDEGRAYVYHGSPSTVSASPNWFAEGNQTSAFFGVSVMTAGDTNGDGYADVIVGAYLFDNGQTDEGAAWVFLGGPTGLSTSAAWMQDGDWPGGRFGFSVATAGDVNADGYADIVVGAYRTQFSLVNEGAAYVYLGGSGGPSLSRHVSWYGQQTGAALGRSVFTAGDVNGDGYADVAVGANGYDTVSGGQGRVLVYHGSASGLPATASWVSDGNASASEYGKSVATAGDVNGDGYSDLLVGDPTYDNGHTNEGIEHLFLGSAEGLSTVRLTRSGSQTNEQLGRAVASAGDVNGDGFSDVIVTAEGTQQFQAYYGTRGAFPSTPSWIATNPPNVASQEFGTAVASAGDVNGDGYDDVFVGDPLYTGSLFREGRVALYYGSATGLLANVSHLFVGNDQSVNFGKSLASAGDVNGDGYADIIIGAPDYFFTDGAAFIYHGSSSGPDSTAPTTTIQGNNNHLGGAVASAGDFNGDGFSDVIVCGTGDKRAYLYLGSPQGVQLTPWTLQPDSNAIACNSVAHLGDVNGDGYSDVAFGDHAANRVYGFYGSPGGPASSPDWIVIGIFSSDFGTVAAAGDVNNDGYSDVLVGAGMWDGVGTNSGKAFVYLGSATGLAPVAAWEANGAMGSAFLGRSLASAGDVNGDGFADVVVGAFGWDGVGANNGRFHLYLGGGGDGMDRIPRQQRSAGVSQPPIALLGVSTTTSSFRLRSRARSAAGRIRLQVEYDVRSWSDAFGAQGIHFSNELMSSPPAGDGTRTNFSSLISGLEAGTTYKWRLRFRSSSPHFPRSPWFHLQGNGVGEWTIRTKCVPVTWYEDNDGDGYGNPSMTISTCESSPSGYVANNFDCDDGNSSIHPGATELFCDGVDNDCSVGTPDAPDLDGDGRDICDPVDPGDVDGQAADCQDQNPDAWAIPGPTQDLVLTSDGLSTTLTWSNPEELGGVPGVGEEYHDVVRSFSSTEFANPALASCIASGLPVRTYVDSTVLPGEGVAFYLTRTGNECGVGPGGFDSDGVEQTWVACP